MDRSTINTLLIEVSSQQYKKAPPSPCRVLQEIYGLNISSGYNFTQSYYKDTKLTRRNQVDWDCKVALHLTACKFGLYTAKKSKYRVNKKKNTVKNKVIRLLY